MGLSQHYERFDLDFVAQQNTTTIRFTALPSSFAKDLDNVSLVAINPPVPEPTTWALLLGGFGFSALVARRRESEPLRG